ncbi:MAG: hypothetical protein V3V72_13445 [Ignavibacteriaceae bacterium]
MKNTHGGKRENAGAPKKPKGQHKKLVWFYFEQDYIKKLGGLKKMQDDIKKWLYSKIKI